MPLLTTWGLVFILSLVVLIKASEYFTDSAESLGHHFGVPSFVVGVAIVALGTSLPELASSIFAVVGKSSEIVIGNVIGSNIANIFLILGITAVVGRKFKVKYELIHVDLPMLVGSAFILSLMIMDNVFTLFESLLSLGGATIYVLHATRVKREAHAELGTDAQAKRESRTLGWKVPVTMLTSVLAIYLGARYTVESVINLSDVLNVGPAILAVIPVSLGTSLPELAVSITAIRQKKPEIALGNILGSNVFNAFAVMGVAGLFGTILVPRNIVSFGIPMMLVSTLLYFFITQDREVTRWEGWLLILFYVFFLGQIMFFV